MIKLIIYSVAFRKDYYFERWRLFRDQHPDFDLILVGPKYSEYKHAGDVMIFQPEEKEAEERFRIEYIDINKYKFKTGGWISFELSRLVKKENPDIVYLIGLENSNCAIHMALIKRIYRLKFKLVGFTMRGVDHPIDKFQYRNRIKLTNRCFDAFICHYPRGKELIEIQRRFKKPVYMSTQVGVHKGFFFKNSELRNETRKALGFSEDVTVFGAVGRLKEYRGIFHLLEAFKTFNENAVLVFVGDGPDRGKLEDMINKFQLHSKVLILGRKEHPYEMNAFFNALDCLVHYPHVEDTFPFTIVESMAVGLPVIASNKGAMSYQLGFNGIIVPAENPIELRKAMVYALENRLTLVARGQALQERVLATFEVHELNKTFYKVMLDVLSGGKERNELSDQAMIPFQTIA
jgi:glycosyltransferase involved in cell wall biosynthesis